MRQKKKCRRYFTLLGVEQNNNDEHVGAIAVFIRNISHLYSVERHNGSKATVNYIGYILIQ